MKHLISLLTITLLCYSAVYGISDQTGVLVMGVGKSGTSCVTGILEIMGVYLGDNLREAGQEFNIKGTFEDLAINQIDRDIFSVLGICTYHAHLVRNIDQLPELDKYRSKIDAYLKKQFQKAPIFGIKSNRMCLLAPLYLSALKELNITPKIIVVLRQPEHIAASRFKRWPEKYTSKEDAYLHIIVYYMNTIELLARDVDVFVMYYEDLLNNPRETINRIQAFIPELYTYEQAKDAINTFLDTQLNHSNS